MTFEKFQFTVNFFSTMLIWYLMLREFYVNVMQKKLCNRNPSGNSSCFLHYSIDGVVPQLCAHTYGTFYGTGQPAFVCRLYQILYVPGLKTGLKLETDWAIVTAIKSIIKNSTILCCLCWNPLDCF